MTPSQQDLFAAQGHARGPADQPGRPAESEPSQRQSDGPRPLQCGYKPCKLPARSRAGSRFCSDSHKTAEWERTHPRVKRLADLDRDFERWLSTEWGQRLAREATARALELQRRGVSHYGIGAIWESIRFDWTLRGYPADDFKANNNHRSRLARKIMAEHPELAGFFETRQLRQ